MSAEGASVRFYRDIGSAFCRAVTVTVTVWAEPDGPAGLRRGRGPLGKSSSCDGHGVCGPGPGPGPSRDAGVRGGGQQHPPGTVGTPDKLGDSPANLLINQGGYDITATVERTRSLRINDWFGW